MRKLFLITMFLCMTFFNAMAQKTVTIDGIKYHIENGEATIAVQDETLSGDIVIPESISYDENNYSVVRATNGAFQNTDITGITLPNSITSLGNSCFKLCNKLTSVKLPDNITSLGDETFMTCSKLSSINITNTLTSLGEFCLAFCNITKLTLPNSITNLGNNCFQSCENLETITLPQNITNLPAYCFHDCKKLSGITLHEGITSLGESCFEGCSSLTSIKLPKSINKITGSIFTSCFENCSNLSEVTCQWDNLDGIDVGSDAFNNIFSEAKLYIPKGTTAMYKAKEPWSNFKYISEENDITEDAEKCQTPTIGY